MVEPQCQASVFIRKSRSDGSVDSGSTWKSLEDDGGSLRGWPQMVGRLTGRATYPP